jgi:acyl-CoA synthetase (AMP-forming)/AMP-acid ligase II
MSLLGQAAENPQKPAVIMAGSGETLTYGELVDGMNRLSRVLRAQCEIGDRVAMLMDNERDYFTVAWGVRRAGLRGVPVNSHLTAAEVAYMVDNSDAVALIVSAGLIDVAEEVRKSNDRLAICLTNGEATAAFGSLQGALAGSSPEPLENASEGNLMFYSSGTTGYPKAIKRPLPEAPFGTYSNWELLMQGQYGVTEDTVLLIAGPAYHAAPMGWSQGCQAIGGTVVLLERFDAEACLAAIERYGVTHALFVPTHFVRMLNLPEAVRARYDVSSLRRVVHSAAPCPPHVKRAMIEWFGPIIDEYYSATEAAGFTVVDSETWLRKPGTVGRPLGGIPHILDEDGRELPVGETGAVYFEGVDSFEYHGDPGKTSEFFNDRGWGCNGDMGWLDEDGYLFLADRRSHMIISGGVNIYPQESENVLFAHPSVADVAVIGVPNDEYGEEVKAVVELRPEAGAGNDELAEELLAFCRANLAHYKCPKSVDFVEELPRTPTGKVRKRDIRQAYWGEGRRQQIV